MPAESGQRAISTIPELLPEGENLKVMKVRRHPSRRRRRLLLRVGLIFVLVTTIGAATIAWLAHRADGIRFELTAASSLLSQFKGDLLAQDETAARETLTRITTHTNAARAYSSDPVWKAASVVPWLGPNFSATSEVAQSADDVVLRAAHPLLEASKSLDWSSLFPGDGSVDAASLEEASPRIISAAKTVELTHARLSEIDESRLLPLIAGPLAEVVDTLDDLRSDLSLAGNVSGILSGMLGEESPRNYLILIQNSAEVRATGGLPGSLAVLTIDKGHLKLSAQSTGSAMDKFNPPVGVDADQTVIFSSRLGSYIGDVNLTPDFPTAALSAKRMWETRHAESIDGVVAIDPVVLAHILKASGPINVPTRESNLHWNGLPQALTSENVVPTLLSDVYRKLNTNEEQDAYFAAASQQVFEALASGQAPGPALLKALAQSFEENRVHVWSDHKDDQDILKDISLGGSSSGPSVGGASFGAYFNDGTGAKMDYYVQRTVQLVEVCTNNEYAEYKVRVVSTNTAPADAAVSLPVSVTGKGTFGTPPGSVQTNVVIYGPAMSHVDTTLQDGQRVSFGSHVDGNRPVGIVTTRLAPGQTSEVEMNFIKVVQNSDPKLSVTPTVQDVKDVMLPISRARCS